MLAESHLSTASRACRLPVALQHRTSNRDEACPARRSTRANKAKRTRKASGHIRKPRNGFRPCFPGRSGLVEAAWCLKDIPTPTSHSRMIGSRTYLHQVCKKPGTPTPAAEVSILKRSEIHCSNRNPSTRRALPRFVAATHLAGTIATVSEVSRCNRLRRRLSSPKLNKPTRETSSD